MQQINTSKEQKCCIFKKAQSNFLVSVYSIRHFLHVELLVSSDLYVFFSDTAPLDKDKMRKIVLCDDCFNSVAG